MKRIFFLFLFAHLFLVYPVFGQKKCCMWSETEQKVIDHVVTKIQNDRTAGIWGTKKIQMAYYRQKTSEGFQKFEALGAPFKIVEFPVSATSPYVEFYVIIDGLTDVQLNVYLAYFRKHSPCLFKGVSEFTKIPPEVIRPTEYGITSKPKPKKGVGNCQVTEASTKTAKAIRTAIGAPAGKQTVIFGTYTTRSEGVQFFEKLGGPFEVVTSDGKYQLVIKNLTDAQADAAIKAAKSGDCLFKGARKGVAGTFGVSDPNAPCECCH